MILCCDFGSNSTSHAFSWKPYSKFCMCTKNIAGCYAKQHLTQVVLQQHSKIVTEM